MTWLVVGGAGYIGAHVVAGMRAADVRVAVLDDLSTGLAARVPDDVPLVKADVRDAEAVHAALREHRVSGVVHLAARKDVSESLVDPLRYYGENVDGLRVVLAAMEGAGVDRIVYSSSAAVYGTPRSGRVTERSPTLPVHPYGRTKLAGEWLVADAAAATGLRFVALRYFNVAGAGAPDLGDVGAGNLLPRLLRARCRGEPATVYGLDHPTPDGSCVRDYVHVADIAEAHVRAALALESDAVGAEVLNLGRGTGVSVLAMVEAVGRATGRPLHWRAAPRRTGDPPSVVATVDRARRRLGWRARRSRR